MAKHTYEVVVGNVGSVYSGPSKQLAQEAYVEYVELSIRGVGRVGGESVVMFQDDEIYAEHTAEE